ncbi:fluoride efflux transporter FluC [Arcanobacterium canis]
MIAFLALAAGLGAACRFLLDDALTSADSRMPRGTWVVNTLGSFLLGICAGAANTGALSSYWLAILGTGFCGGFTTFSTASLDSVKLAHRGERWIALLNSTGMIVVCVAAAAVGLTSAHHLC